MKKISFMFIMFFFIFLGFFSSSFADIGGYLIENYDTKIHLNTGGELNIKENIIVIFSEPRHGIYRNIPFIYEGNNKKKVTTNIYDIKVSGYDYKVNIKNNDYNIKIGNPNFTVNGKQNYTIKYKVYGGIKNFSGYQEVYWNMIGDKRNTVIKNFKFLFILPKNIELKEGDYYAIYGKYGERKPVKVIKKGRVIYMIGKIKLEPKEAVTLAIKLPPNYVNIDGKKNLKIPKLSKNFPWYLLIFFIPLIFGIYLFNLRKKYGKDEEIKDVIYYTPPKGYTPGQIASIYEKKQTNRAAFATIYSWATNGYIKIQYEKQNVIKSKIIIEKIKEKQNMLSYEKKLWDIFFGGIRTKFDFNNTDVYNEISNFKTRSYYSIEKDIFTPESIKLKKVILKIVFLGFIFSFILVFLLKSLCKGLYTNSFLISLALSAIFFILFYKYISKLSPKGKEIYEQISGYKRYLKAVEEPKLEQLIKDDPNYFEKILPFVIALGMETERIRKCSQALKDINYKPDRISDYGFDNDVSSVTSCINDSISGFGKTSAFSPPSNSNSNSDSDFDFDYDGFSGGGGGGGGGGSW